MKIDAIAIIPSSLKCKDGAYRHEEIEHLLPSVSGGNTPHRLLGAWTVPPQRNSRKAPTPRGPRAGMCSGKAQYQI